LWTMASTRLQPAKKTHSLSNPESELCIHGTVYLPAHAQGFPRTKAELVLPRLRCTRWRIRLLAETCPDPQTKRVFLRSLGSCCTTYASRHPACGRASTPPQSDSTSCPHLLALRGAACWSASRHGQAAGGYDETMSGVHGGWEFHISAVALVFRFIELAKPLFVLFSGRRPDGMLMAARRECTATICGPSLTQARRFVSIAALVAAFARRLTMRATISAGTAVGCSFRRGSSGSLVHNCSSLLAAHQDPRATNRRAARFTCGMSGHVARFRVRNALGAPGNAEDIVVVLRIGLLLGGHFNSAAWRHGEARADGRAYVVIATRVHAARRANCRESYQPCLEKANAQKKKKKPSIPLALLKAISDDGTAHPREQSTSCISSSLPDGGSPACGAVGGRQQIVLALTRASLGGWRAGRSAPTSKKPGVRRFKFRLNLCAPGNALW